uniref:Putative nuclear receptor nhr-48 n=1 Tax=Corethrella appendiculata TaxID=1370023 RepID=U5EXZ5_9DIPT
MSTNNKICTVCGDKALGYNFNAVTCESCKAFFRRNALSQKDFTCPFNDNCEITVVTRRFCQKCRLKKCFRIGMKKEYIMSEEDKVLKRKKIEQNRAKKRQSSNHQDADDDIQGTVAKIKCEQPQTDNETSWDTIQELVSNEFISQQQSSTQLDSLSVPSPVESNTSGSTSLHVIGLTIDSNPSEIVNRIVNYPTQSSHTIASLMKTPEDAVHVMWRIINSKTDALKLISHFIQSPGDALQIISKIMNSPLDALTVFAQFMSSPTDALQIISKVVSSPNDVLSFMQQLMMNPENAVQIMNKFMCSPAEALQMINRMINHSEIVDKMTEATSTTIGADTPPSDTTTIELNRNLTIKNVLETTTTSTSTPVNQQQENEQQFTSDSDEQIAFAASSTVFAASSTVFESNIFEDIEQSPIKPNSMESILCEAIRLEYSYPTTSSSTPTTSATASPTSSMPIFSSLISSVGSDLNDAEHSKLNELLMANKALYAPVDEDLATLISDECGLKSNQNEPDPLLLRVINLTAIAIRRIIKMSKKISAFKNMCQEDQLALLKGGCTEMMILRSAMQYDSDRATWTIPHSQEEMSNIKADVLKLAKGNFYAEHERFIMTFDQKWRMDENIILIMCAITLFTPDRPKVVHADVVKLEQNSYYYLLRRYLETIYNGCEAKSAFLKLMQKISELHTLNNEVVGVYLNINPSQVEPLLREIFDLKAH